MKFFLFQRATVAVLAFASQVFANPVPSKSVPASSGSANPWPPDPWPAKPVPAAKEPWPPRVVYHKRPHLWRNGRSPTRPSETRVALALQARSSIQGMGDRVSSGAGMGLFADSMQDAKHTRLCKRPEIDPGPAVPTVGKPLANIEDCAALAEKLRRRAPYYINYNEFPHAKHKKLVKYKSCSIGVQLSTYMDTLQWDINVDTILFLPKAVMMTNQDLLDALFEAMADPTVDGKIGMRGAVSCPDWLSVYNPQREDYRPRWFMVHWDVYGDQWEDTSHT